MRILAALLALLLVPAYGESAAGAVVPVRHSPAPVAHVHTSSRFDRSPASLAAELHRIRSSGPDVITVTEVDADRRARVLRAPRWGVYRAPGTDVAVSWRRDRWRLAGARAGALAAGQGAAWVVLDRRPPRGRAANRAAGRAGRILVSLAHLPSHVEYGDRWRPGAGARVATWQAAVRAWSAQLEAVRARRHPAVTLVVADWNVDVRRPAWRRVIRAQFGRLALTWRRGHLPRAGTHAGRRLIDATLSDARGRARLLPRTASSDHRPYLEHLWTRAPQGE